MLTNAQVREAKPRTIRYEITCDALPGFILRVLPTGKKVFFARYRDADGKDHRHRLGLVGLGYGVDEARREAMAILARRESPTSGGEPTPAAKAATTAPTSSPKTLTVREFALRFEQEHIDMFLKPETASHFRSSLRRYILPVLGDRPLDEVTTLEVQQLVNKLKPTPCAANYARCVLSCLFTKAIKWLPELKGRANPVKDVSRFAERAVERFLSPDEREALERVLYTAERTPPGRKEHIGRDGIWAIRLLSLTGMRRDEIRDLRWEQVNWRQKVLRLPDSKTGKRDIVVSDEVMALLGKIGQAKGHPQRGLVVCSKTGNKLHSLGATWRTGAPPGRHPRRHPDPRPAPLAGQRRDHGRGPARGRRQDARPQELPHDPAVLAHRRHGAARGGQQDGQDHHPRRAGQGRQVQAQQVQPPQVEVDGRRTSSGAFDRTHKRTPAARRRSERARCRAIAPSEFGGSACDFVQSPRDSAPSTVERVRTTAQVPIEFG
jgi:integrase